MKLLEAIIVNIVKEHRGDITGLNIESLFEKECYKALKRIKTILEDDRLEDKECFEKIESIVCLFEEMGSGCGTRHDFG